MRAVLVTGGAGFIGSAFVRTIHAAHPALDVVVLDSLTYAGNAANLAELKGRPAIRCVRGDICDRSLVESLLREFGIDVVVNFAAESHVDRSISGPDSFVTTNIIGTQRLLESARAVWLNADRRTPHRFHQVSTDEVFGPLPDAANPFDERSAYAPSSPYSASKASADHLVRAYQRTYGLDVSISYSSNNYGPRQFPEKLVPLTIVNLLRGEPVGVYGDGLHRRGWQHVEDHCRGLLAVIERGGTNEAYCLGADRETDNLALVTELCAQVDRYLGTDPVRLARFPRSAAARGGDSRDLVRLVADRAGHDRRYGLDSSKARTGLDYAPGRELTRGLTETVSWYVENESWWRAALDGSYRQGKFED